MNQSDISYLLAKKDFTIKNTGLTYRTINNWSEQGLLSHLRESEGKWHRLTFMELLEVCIYKELKALGFSIEKMHSVKEAFYKKSHTKFNSGKLKKAGVILDKNYFTENILRYLDGKELLYLAINPATKEARFVDSLSEIEMKPANKTKSKLPRNENSLVIVNIHNIIKELNLDTELMNERIFAVMKLLQKNN